MKGWTTELQERRLDDVGPGMTESLLVDVVDGEYVVRVLLRSMCVLLGGDERKVERGERGWIPRQRSVRPWRKRRHWRVEHGLIRL